MRFKLFCWAAALALCASTPVALADPGHGPGPYMPDPGHDGHRDWHGGDMRHFHEHDINVWRGGRWIHGPHGGRDGWWWVVAGLWYFFPAPVYPYPDPYVPPEAVAEPPAPPTQVWYYCKQPRGYYPYVPACRHWVAVPAQP